MSRASRPRELLVGPFTSSQARAAGLTAEQLRSACWRRLFHGVYIAAELADTVALCARAIGLVLPPDAVVGYSTAAWLHGVDVRPSPYFAAVEVIAQRGDQIRRQGVHARSAKLDEADVVHICGVPVTTPVRTAFDLARQPDLIEAVVGVDAMLNRGGCRLDALTEYVATHRKWRACGVPRPRSLMRSRSASHRWSHGSECGSCWPGCLDPRHKCRSATRMAGCSPTSTTATTSGGSASTTTVRSIGTPGGRTPVVRSASATKAGGIVAIPRSTSWAAGAAWSGRSARRCWQPAGAPEHRRTCHAVTDRGHCSLLDHEMRMIKQRAAGPCGRGQSVVVGGVGAEVLVIAVVVAVAQLAALGGKLRLQTLEIGAAAAVLQLAGDLRLLGLGPAAPHWLDPLDEPGVPAVNTEMSVHLPAILAGPPRITCPGPWGRRDQRPGSQNRRSRPISAIRRSASRSAATAGGTPSSAASRKIRRVVSKISVALARARGSE